MAHRRSYSRNPQRATRSDVPAAGLLLENGGCSVCARLPRRSVCTGLKNPRKTGAAQAENENRTRYGSF